MESNIRFAVSRRPVRRRAVACATEPPTPETTPTINNSKDKWRGGDLNPRPPGYESSALNQLSYLARDSEPY